MLHKTAFLQEAAPELLAYFEQYFEVPYSLPKLDFFGIPTNQPSAFEGWGIILSYG